MPYVMMPQYPGQPVIALRVDEKHYAHIQSGERASLVIFPLVPKNRSPKELPLPKLNMTAACKAIVEPQDVANIVDKYGSCTLHSYLFFSECSFFDDQLVIFPDILQLTCCLQIF